MSDHSGWARLEAEARSAPAGGAWLPLRAYSEFMPPPYVGVKPYRPDRRARAATGSLGDGHALDVTEYEQAHELGPGLSRIADHVVAELGKLVRGESHGLSRTLLTDNPAWPAELAAAAAAGRLADDPIVLLLPLALSRTQDDKGNTRWTLFGASHRGADGFWRSFDRDEDDDDFDRVLDWCGHAGGVAVHGDPASLPPALRGRALGDSLAGVRAVVSFEPFARLPAQVRAAYLARELALVPCPASLVFFEHPRYRALAAELPHAMQIPLLHLFPRVEGSCTIRIPQSGWLDEDDGGEHGHRVVSRVARTHRWQRQARDAGLADGVLTDHVSVALFSTDPDVLGLYDKPMAKNVQIWTEDYRLVLDGPRADAEAIARAQRQVDAGGRFGYRFVFPPMRGGARDLYWHLPLVARRDPATGKADVLDAQPPVGVISAELAVPCEDITLAPRLLARAPHVAAASQFTHDAGRMRHTTSHNARKLLDTRDLLGDRLPPSFARALLRIARHVELDDWLSHLPQAAAEELAGGRLAVALRACLGDAAADEPGPGLTFEHTATRGFEEKVWTTIASLAEGEYRHKENADRIVDANHGKTGGPAAQAAGVEAARRRDLERLGDHLHDRYRALIEASGMTGRAEVVDQVFAWQTDFAYPWMEGWAKNQRGAHERNVVMIIPGRDRGQAVIMADHYDTAYMEDVYDADRGGDKLRVSALGADDNHSATTALLAAAEVLLPMAKAGLLARDVWLVHLTGEEFPADSLGARALCQALLEQKLVFTAEDGGARDRSQTQVTGVYVLDMIGHNTHRDRDVFQIAPGEGAAAARLALRAHHATVRWNRCAAERNREREGLGRAERMPDGARPPPPFAHLPLTGEVRVEWEPESALYNTDGQAFSDVGIPVVLFMENYDISRTGYHDTLDTMANIDLDYAAALTAIAIESVADAACAPLERASLRASDLGTGDADDPHRASPIGMGHPTASGAP